MIYALCALILVTIGIGVFAFTKPRQTRRVSRVRFSGTVRKYDVGVTPEIKLGGACTQGLLYGISGGVATLATNVAGGFIYAIGFALQAYTTRDYTDGKNGCFPTRGILDLNAADIVGGALTAGAPVYLATGGLYTPTSPTVNGTLRQVVGMALTTTRVLVDIVPPSAKAQTAGNSNIGAL